MSDVKVLRTAVQSLFPITARAEFVHVPQGKTPPWSRVLISIPRISSRRLDGGELSRRCTIRTLAVAANEQAAWIIADALMGLEGSRPSATGWSCSPIRLLNNEPVPFEDVDAVVPNTARPLVCIPLDFEFFANERTTP